MPACHASFNPSPRAQAFIGLGLMAFMLATRFHHFGDALHLPDASWTIFFLAGFYLSPVWLGALLLQAVAIDAVAVGWLGVSDYCITPAYAALQLAHLVLWQGGRWLRKHHRDDVTGLRNLAMAGPVAVGLAFLISNTSFYWLGGRVAEPGMGEFVAQIGRYLPSYLGINALYLAAAVLLHGVLTQAASSHRRA